MNGPDARAGTSARFGPFTFDPSRGELRRDGVPVRLPPRVADVLEHFVRHPGEVLLRDELLSWVWGDLGRTSADARLNSCVRRLRGALGDDAQAPVFIETVHKRGYRFLAPVEWREPVSATRPRPSAARVRILATAMTVLGLSLAALWYRPAAPSVVPSGWESHYLRGRHLATSGLRDDARSGRAMLLEVTTVAPNVPGVWSGLATAETTLGGLVLADRYARRALRLDGSSSEAHRVLAEVALGLHWDIAQAEVHALRAIELDPWSSLAYSTHAYTLALQGRWESAISQARRSLAIDPFRSLVAGDLAYFLFWAGRHDEAVEQAGRALAIEPDLRAALGAMRSALLARGDTVAAEEPTLRLLSLDGADDLIEEMERGTPGELQLAYLHWRARRAEEGAGAERWVQLAVVRAELGDHAGAAAAGERALAERARGLPMLLVDPRLDGVLERGSLSSVEAAVRGA